MGENDYFSYFALPEANVRYLIKMKIVQTRKLGLTHKVNDRGFAANFGPSWHGGCTSHLEIPIWGVYTSQQRSISERQLAERLEGSEEELDKLLFLF
jgi:hypothetical protein